MPEFILELFRSSWIYERLQQAIEDGFFESQEEFSYFAANVFAPMFLYFMLYTIFVFFCTICLGRFGLLLIDLLEDVIRRIYRRLRYGRVIHLYPPKKQPPFNRKV